MRLNHHHQIRRETLIGEASWQAAVIEMRSHWSACKILASFVFPFDLVQRPLLTSDYNYTHVYTLLVIQIDNVQRRPRTHRIQAGPLGCSVEPDKPDFSYGF